MTMTFFELCTVYIYKVRTILFQYLLINLFKQRYISSVERYCYWNKFMKNNGPNVF